MRANVLSIAALRDLKVGVIRFQQEAQGGLEAAQMDLHRLIEWSKSLSSDLKIVAVFESPLENVLNNYSGQHEAPFPLIPDPQGELYELYGLEISESKVMASLSRPEVQQNIEAAAHVVESVRNAVGSSVQLCVDHFGEGYLSTDEVIRFGHALEKYDLAWMEDPVPFFDVKSHKKVADALLTPIASGENLYLREGFRDAIRTRAYDILHPDLLSSGGLLETKRIADDGEEEGIPTALHCAGSPIGFMANVHCAAAISSFLAVEHHGLDLPFWHSLVTGFEDDYFSGGYVKVPEKPGLGLDLNLEAVEENLRTPGTMFMPTPEWDLPKLSFWRPDNRWPE